MFLTSDAFRAIDKRQLLGWDWRAISILLISHDWDPMRDGAEALASRRLVRALLAAGARVHVLSSACADDELVHPNYSVTVVPKPAVPSGRARRALMMMRSTVPEVAGAWVAPAVKAGRRVLSSMPEGTFVYGRAMPGASNVVAWHLATATGRPWLAHYSDEWPSIHVLPVNRKWLAPYKWPLFELWRWRITRDAGALTFTNPRQGSEFLGQRRRQCARKAFVVTHLPSDFFGSIGPQQYDRFHIVHTGGFYPPGHTAAALLEGLRLFLDRTPSAQGRVRFTQAGSSDGDVGRQAERHGLQDIVRCTGRLSQAGVKALLEDASLLVGIDYTRERSTTMLSKLPDYVYARRPILAIAAPESAIGCLFSEDGAGLTAHFASPEQVAGHVATVFDAWHRRSAEAWLPRRAALDSFHPRQVLLELAAAFMVARHAHEQKSGNRQAVAAADEQIAPESLVG